MGKTMHTLYSLSKHLTPGVFLAVLATQVLFICNASSLNLTNAYLHHKCLVSQGTYKSGSQYEKNLNFHVRLISTANFRYGFDHMTTAYETPNNVTIIYQCRGDSYRSNKCRSCFSAAISGLRRRCLRNKGGIIWFDQCFVEITAIDSMEVNYENIFSLHNPNKVSGDEKLFNMETTALLEQLTLKANRKDNMEDNRLALYAAGEKVIGKTTLYAMVQCTRDIFITPKECKECLETIIREYPNCCDGKQGGRVFGTSCNFRYEIYPFLRT